MSYLDASRVLEAMYRSMSDKADYNQLLAFIEKPTLERLPVKKYQAPKFKLAEPYLDDLIKTLKTSSFNFGYFMICVMTVMELKKCDDEVSDILASDTRRHTGLSREVRPEDHREKLKTEIEGLIENFRRYVLKAFRFDASRGYDMTKECSEYLAWHQTRGENISNLANEAAKVINTWIRAKNDMDRCGMKVFCHNFTWCSKCAQVQRLSMRDGIQLPVKIVPHTHATDECGGKFDMPKYTEYKNELATRQQHPVHVQQHPVHVQQVPLHAPMMYNGYPPAMTYGYCQPEMMYGYCPPPPPPPAPQVPTVAVKMSPDLCAVMNAVTTLRGKNTLPVSSVKNALGSDNGSQTQDKNANKATKVDRSAAMLKKQELALKKQELALKRENAQLLRAQTQARNEEYTRQCELRRTRMPSKVSTTPLKVSTKGDAMKGRTKNGFDLLGDMDDIEDVNQVPSV